MTRVVWATVAVAMVVLGATGSPASAVPEGQACGGFVGQICEKRLWCDRAPGACWFPLAGGVCVRTPQFCPRIYKPVCGCNGQTYGNDCERRAARVPKLRNGEC